MEKTNVIKKSPNSNFLTKSFSNFRNVKKNFNTVRANPYAFQKFSYYIFRFIIIIVGLIVVYQLIKIFLSFSAGSNPIAASLGRVIIVLVMVIFIYKLYQMNSVQKKRVDHYEKNPKSIFEGIPREPLDINKEIDSILNRYDAYGNLKGGKK